MKWIVASVNADPLICPQGVAQMLGYFPSIWICLCESVYERKTAGTLIHWEAVFGGLFKAEDIQPSLHVLCIKCAQLSDSQSTHVIVSTVWLLYTCISSNCLSDNCVCIHYTYTWHWQCCTLRIISIWYCIFCVPVMVLLNISVKLIWFKIMCMFLHFKWGLNKDKHTTNWKSTSPIHFITYIYRRLHLFVF